MDRRAEADPLARLRNVIRLASDLGELILVILLISIALHFLQMLGWTGAAS
jgi:hypothetical protein